MQVPSWTSVGGRLGGLAGCSSSSTVNLEGVPNNSDRMSSRACGLRALLALAALDLVFRRRGGPVAKGVSCSNTFLLLSAFVALVFLSADSCAAVEEMKL